MKEVIEVLNKVHDFLGILIRENLIKESPYLDEEPMLKVSDLADDLWEVIHKKLPCNNAAKMREALKEAKRTLCRWQADLPALAWVEVETALCKIESSLSAPPRNCDKIPDVHEMSIAESPLDMSLVVAPREELLRFIYWLFAEAKGESK